MDVPAAGSAAPRAGRREYIGLAVLALPTLLLALDMSVLYMALPHLAADLDASAVQQLWITDIYGFMVAGLLITMGRIGDRIGRRRLLLIGAAAFSVASILAAYSQTAEMLIVTRVLLGIAGSTLMPSTLTLISNMFRDPKQHAMAIGVWMGCFLGGTTFGPVIGGVMLEFFWWGSVFLLGVPIMVLLLIVGPRTLPEYKDPDAGPIDPTSVALSLGAVIGIVYGLKEVSRDGFVLFPTIAMIVGAVLAVLFLQRQRTLAHPLLDLSLFRIRTLSSSVTMSAFAGLLAGAHLFVYLYLQLVQELPPIQAALWMLPSGLTTLVSLMVGPLIAAKIRPAYVMAAGLVIVAFGYLLITQVGGDGDLALLVSGLVAVAAGIGPAAGLSASLALGSVPVEKSGTAAAVNETAAEFGIAMGIALMGVVGTAVYRHQMDETIPAGLPGDVAATARESAPGAASVAQDAGAQAAQLINAAHDALAAALNSAAWVSVGIAVGLTVLAIAGLRHEPPTGEKEAEGAAADPAAPAAVAADADVPPAETAGPASDRTGAQP
ncbi:MFS transporter [Actinomadura flavalba]|uniref:MFS transporter n=1 Tax=Actinomadura flavalba TaxID=1120938 RepID=UPI0004767A96|nr:MFS transporter [Actinomadura flavalba]